ncbi:HPr family phosphocarrier protein [Eoetvoesiella caeni]|uniref:Phosphocarrier protein n=1 Tax=Eoetvoesiella caeni TaxID=645616 RepID=A0A366HEB0_9BURK|nr:HPr family phosphocarrier protein [Eoetvoesiella caeni]MCI2808706.1 HPr family phosphocarrier protein [Eoetvoesiella caeni]NYT55247.1 HPr family phosphocarrier protein [Eoetvoesiella caeni]RBP40771.1 phosphocarrier protein [Eoetvoesiella caeni]
MPTVDIVISNKLGLHARAAAKLTQLAGRFAGCEIFIARGAQRVNAKSIMGVMMLAAGLGVTVKIDANGPDAEAALGEIQALFHSKFGEQE